MFVCFINVYLSRTLVDRCRSSKKIHKVQLRFKIHKFTKKNMKSKKKNIIMNSIMAIKKTNMKKNKTLSKEMGIEHNLLKLKEKHG